VSFLSESFITSLTTDIPTLIECSPVSTEVGINRALELANEVADASSGLAVELADVGWLHVVADGSNIVAVFSVVSDDADVGDTGIRELVDFAVAGGDMADLTKIKLALLY
jgi:hypothetical protein